MRKKISRIKRGLAVMLSVCMVFGVAPIQAGAEENDSEIAVQANDSAGKTEQQSTEEEECKHEGIEITFNSNGFGNCPKCNAAVYQPATETTDKYDINDDGTKDTVYEISNAGQLFWFAGLVNGTLDGVKQNPSANAILTANITVNENLLDSLQYDAEGNVSNGSDFITWTPIAAWMGNRTTQYSGMFDGNNKTVSGLYFNGDSTCIGLFGSSESDGNIKNVGVVDSYFKGNDHVGGVCGNNAGTITNCYNAGNLTAIESSADIGGICGYNNGGTIANCYNTGTVTATGSIASVGGVCGCSIAPISNCYNIGTVTATSSGADISGICGYYFGPVTNCYYLADTEDENGGKTAAQFASGEVAYLLNGSKSEGDMVHFYQIIGKDKAPVLDKSHGVVYFYTDCTDKTFYANSETASGEHDFDENGFCTKDNTHYQPATLNETTGNYEISNAGQLYWFAGLVNGTLDGVEQNTSANAILTADIIVNKNVLKSDGTLNEGTFKEWTPITGSSKSTYSGIFDGQNHTISGLYFNQEDSYDVGLFGRNNGKIANAGILDSYFYGTSKVGGVCGNNYTGTITNCYNTGSVSGLGNLGGVSGNNYTGSITNCYNTGNVSGSSGFVGGVSGSNSKGTIINSYNAGSVSGLECVGGVSGDNYTGSITDCYNIGNVSGSEGDVGGVNGYNNGGTITNCYNVGSVSGTDCYVGGVSGKNANGTIINSYNAGSVSGKYDVGGVSGENANGTITNCYYDSTIYTGTAIGANSSGTTEKVEGKTTDEFKTGEVAYLLSQGCSTGEGDNTVTYDGSIWGQALGENGDTYPVLKKAGDVENTVYRNEAYQGCEGNPGVPVYSYSNTQETPVYAEHTDEDLDGKCDICNLDLKTFKQLGLLIAKVNKNLSDGKYADVQYTTASIDNLRMALVAAGAVTEASSDTDIATAFDKLLAASTVGADGLIKADHNIVILFADEGAASGIASGNGWYANGETVTLTVTPSVGYSFSKWTTDKAGNTSVGTESTYTFTLGADSPKAYYAWLDEAKYTVTCKSTEGGTGKASKEQYVYGQKATVTATANDDYEFVGWKDSYGTTVSTDAEYNFTVLGDTTLTPEFVKVKTEEGKEIAYVTVSFYHQSGKLLDSQKVVSGEGKITTTVNAPTKVGFDFLGWSAKASGATAADVVNLNEATFSENTSLYPVFKAQDITYTLTVVGLQTEQKAPQSSVTVTADPIEGKQFVGWKDANGNIVSYDSTYTFIITGDTTLEACYEQADSVIVKEPTITIAQPTYEDITGGYKMAFYFNYTVPEDCKLVDIGIIRKKGDYAADGITLETVGISQYSVLSKLGSEGQFYYTKSNYYGTGHTVTGYMIYEKNGIRYTVYSDSIYGVKNN